VPTTKEQQQFVQAHYDQKKQNKNVTASNSKGKSPGEFRDFFLRAIDVLIPMPETIDFGFLYDDESAAKIHRAFSELRREFAQGVIVRRGKPAFYREGNVIYLGSKSEEGCP